MRADRGLVFILVAALLAGCATAPAATAGIPPAEWATTFGSLSRSLDAWEAALPAARPGAAPIFGAHVLAANANRGPGLLDPQTMPLVDATLDRLAALGVRGATFSISFPLLDPDQPRAADYLAFYETAARHVRDRGMTLSVEQHVAFSGTPFSSIRFDYATLPFDRFVALDHDMAATIIERVRPDFLTLLSEPDTFVRLTGYRQAAAPAGAAAMIGRVVAGLDRGPTKLGAGTGSWLPDAAAYATAFAHTSVDYVDLHIYPLNAAAIGGAQAVVDAARAAGKPVVLDEAWLYKMGPGETVGGWEQTAEYFRRDAFSFWSPLDARFLDLVARFARANGIGYVAPFWTTYFWGWVDYGPGTKDLSYARVAQLANGAVMVGLREGTFTPTGRAYGQAIAGR